MKQHRLQRTALTTCAAAVAALMAVPAEATTFEVGDWQGNWNSSFSVGMGIRARERDSRLYGQDNGRLVGLTDGSGANTIDEGNLNYDKGDRYTTLFKLFSEVELKKGNMGMLVRGKAWYDQALKDEKVKFGNQGNGYNGYNGATFTGISPAGQILGNPGQLGAAAPLDDSGFERLNKFSGLYLLDAYVYNTFDLGGQSLQVRAGNQVINWGESLFIQGLNQINPIDVPSFRKPGAQLKEVFLPVAALQSSLSLGEYGGIEGFWQWQYKNTPVEASCGNYWSVTANNITWGNPGACNNAVTLGNSNPYGAATTLYVPGVTGRKAKNAGQFGLAYRFNSEALDTEFGFYGMNIHSRTPIVSVQIGPNGTASPISVFWEYPENIKVYGASAATNIKGWSVAGEVSFHRGVPVQVDGNDLLNSGLFAGGFGAVLGVPAGTPMGPYGGAAVSAFNGNGYLSGYTRANKTQLQLNTVKAGNGILGAGQYIFIAEAALQLNNLPDYKKDPTAVRYNRAFIFGAGPSGAYGGGCGPTGNPNVQGCTNDGYVSRKSGGYRVKLELTYNDLIPGIAVYPSLFFSHDVFGYSLDNQFIKGRMALSPAVKFSYAKKYTLETGLVRYNRGAKFDPLRDRDSVFLNAGVSF